MLTKLHYPSTAPARTLLAAAVLLFAACSPADSDPAETAAAASDDSLHGHHAHDHGGHPLQDIAAHELGTIDFQVSCSDEAAATFDHGLGYLHHMMYEEARGTFERLIDHHPDCAMGYWGVATTLFQPLWPTRPDASTLQDGHTLIRQARAREPGSSRELALVDATGAFFQQPEDGGWWPRIRSWAAALETAFEAHPDDADTAAFYALSRLALAYEDGERREALHEEAANVLLGVHDRIPDHPGAIHYLIHANDMEGRAGESLEVVARYGEIAPEVPHALHMPSHIYVRLGRWPETIEWNARSADAALNFPAADGISFHYLHAVDYKVYAHLQRGEDDRADAIADAALAKGTHEPNFNSAFHLAAIPARLAVERRDWEAASALAARSPDNQPWDDALWPEGMTWFARGLGAARLGDLESAREAEQRLAALRDQADAAGEAGFATYIEVDRLILAGWIAHAEGDVDADRHLRAAAELDTTVEKHPITPGALYPPNEALGDLLAETGRHDEALAAYQASDTRWPGRYHTLVGAARSAQAAGEHELAQRYYGAVLEMVGESGREAVDEARQYIATR